MQPEFWHERWELKEIGFHEPAGNALLVKYFDQLDLISGHRIFVPLCGKTRDIHWLLNQGLKVVGAELSEIAIGELFDDLNITPQITELDNLKRYSGPNIEIFAGDIFHLNEDLLGHVDAIYDRAALVALPNELRQRYTQRLVVITHRAPQLVISFEYDQTVMQGPPFSISEDEVLSHYEDIYSVKSLETIEVPNGLKGQCDAIERVWYLS